MKESKLLSLPCIPYLLYIPHGSDESASLIAFAKLSKSFISHMVQMKDKNENKKGGKEILYIPHGSDESVNEIIVLLYNSLFISHMVQMKAMRLQL